ncbi:MAG: RNA polymerase-binding protein DksA [SAR324 cluster bacterium]|nr:RNA polymerase-binding protein DksA [SAR324 cluster bacterium]
MKFDTSTIEFNDEEKEHFRKKLLGQLEELFSDSGITMHEMKDAVLEFPDPADRANYEFERNTTLRIRDRERKLIKKVRQAVARLEEGTYNECKECDAEIGKMRLDARPVTDLCINCKEAQEQKEKTRQA